MPTVQSPQMTTPHTPLMKMADDEPWKAVSVLKRDFASDVAEHVLNDRFAAMISLARNAMKVESFKIQIYNEAVFARRKYRANPKFFLRHVCLVALAGRTENSAYDLAGTYATALRDLYESDVEIYDIPAEIVRRGGITRMHTDAILRAAETKARFDNTEDLRSPVSAKGRDGEPKKLERAPGDIVRKRPGVLSKRRPVFDARRDLPVRANKTIRSAVRDNLAEGRPIWVKLEGETDSLDAEIIVATEYAPERRLGDQQPDRRRPTRMRNVQPKKGPIARGPTRGTL